MLFRGSICSVRAGKHRNSSAASLNREHLRQLVLGAHEACWLQLHCSTRVVQEQQCLLPPGCGARWHLVKGVLPLAQEAYRLQLRCFQSMVQEQQHLPSLKQLLKLYTTISLPKLASLMDMNETTLRSQLMLLKVCACRSSAVYLTLFHLDLDEMAAGCIHVSSACTKRKPDCILQQKLSSGCVDLKTYGEEKSACCLPNPSHMSPKHFGFSAVRHAVLAVLCR